MIASQNDHNEIAKLLLEQEGNEEESSISCSSLETEMFPRSQRDNQSASMHEQNHQELTKTNINTKVDIGTQTDNLMHLPFDQNKLINVFFEINHRKQYQHI